VHRTLICLLVALLAGCAAQAPAPTAELPWTVYRDGNGGEVRVLEMAGHECPSIMSGDAPAGSAGGCATLKPTYVIFYPRGDMNARAHELEHVAGMRHGPWVQAHADSLPCAVVTDGGRGTPWKAGDVLCRDRDGKYSRGSQAADGRLVRTTSTD
jgi:hypothetical protein